MGRVVLNAYNMPFIRSRYRACQFKRKQGKNMSKKMQVSLKICLSLFLYILNQNSSFCLENDKAYIHRNPDFSLILPIDWKFIPRDITVAEISQQTGWINGMSRKDFMKLEALPDEYEVFFMKDPLQYGFMLFHKVSDNIDDNIHNLKWQKNNINWLKKYARQDNLNYGIVVINQIEMFNIDYGDRRSYSSIYYSNINGVLFSLDFYCSKASMKCIDNKNKIISSVQIKL